MGADDEDKGRDVSRPGCEVLDKNPAHTENFERGRGRRGADRPHDYDFLHERFC